MNTIDDHLKVLEEFKQKSLKNLDLICALISKHLNKGNGIYAFGNGGSAAEAQHFTGELLGRFENNKRKALRAFCLNADNAAITAIANDYSYDKIFKRQIEGLVHPGDILFGISTSAKSKNVLNGMEYGKEIGTMNILLTGQNSEKLDSIVDHKISVPSTSTAIIQEIHLVIIHHICRYLDKEF
jgi:D-sedoheptulose 7-phosphate isomerase